MYSKHDHHTGIFLLYSIDIDIDININIDIDIDLIIIHTAHYAIS